MREQKIDRLIFFLFAAAAFVYLALRAIYSGPLNDESFTFFRFIHPGKFLPFASSTHLSVNNHVLNNLLAWLSYKAFGVSEWSLRLPNLLAFPLYMWYIYRLGGYLSKNYLRYLFWLLLAGAHYYLEFFAYSRGYGLGIAFLVASVFHLIRADQEGKNISKDLAIGLLFIFLATISNLNLLLPFLIWVLLALKILWLDSINKKPLIFFAIASALLGTFLISWSLKLSSNETLPFGESSLSGTFNSFIHFFTDYTGSELQWLYGLMLTSVLIMGGYWLIKKRSIKISGLSAFYTFFVLAVLGRIILHHGLGINYPLERTGFHWYFFLAGSIPFIIDQFKASLKLPLTIVLFLAFVPVFAFTLQSFSLYSSSNFGWQRQQISDDFYFVTQELNENRDFPLTLYAPENFYTVNMAFKNLKYNGSLNVCNSFRLKETVYSSDLLIIDTARYPECVQLYEEVYYDEHSTMALMKRKPLLNAVAVADTAFLGQGYSEKKFTWLGKFTLEGVSPGSSYRLDCDVALTSPENPLPSAITVEVRDSSGHIISYDQVSLDYFHTNFSEGYEQKLNVVLNNLPAGTQHIRCFLWNLEKKPFLINRAEVVLSRLQEK